MNAGRDVERLIAGWLEEEAVGRAPDRVLEGARRSVNTIGQRRLVVAWREPMYVSPLRLAGLAAVFAVAIVSAAWFGRLTASSSTGGPGPTPTASADASLLDSYRTARREICLRYKPQIDPLIQQLEGIYQPETPTADRASKIRALTQLVTLGEQANAEIAALVVSPDMATDAAVAVDQMHQQNVLIHAELDRFAAGDLAGAESLDQATNPLAEEIAAFDRKYGVPSC